MDDPKEPVHTHIRKDEQLPVAGAQEFLLARECEGSIKEFYGGDAFTTLWNTKNQWMIRCVQGGMAVDEL